MKKLHGLKNGMGRPVLVSAKSEYETLKGTKKMVIIPFDGFFGAATYFHGEDKMTASCGSIEYDGVRCKSYYTEFEHVDNETLLEHLKDEKVSADFREKAIMLLNEIDY